jgi:hypothetical protein
MKKDIKQKILDSITYAREKMGFTLISEDWGDASHKCACAMGCVLLKDNPKDTVRIEAKENTVSAAEILGVTEKWIDCFCEGFDGNGQADASQLPDAWTLGEEVAKETKPIAYHLWDGEPT